MVRASSAEPPRPPIILRHVRRDVERTAGRDEVAGVVSLIAAQGDAATARQPLVGHCEGRAPLGRAIRRLDLKVNQQGVAVLHQRVARVAELGSLPLPLRASSALGVGG